MFVGMYFEVSHNGEERRIYRIHDIIMETARTKVFNFFEDPNVTVTVEQYFLNRYNISLQ